MKFVSYNIQYGIGLDFNYDIARIANAVRGADFIALQEVTRNNPKNGGRDMVAELREALPDYFAAYGCNCQVNIGGRIENGRAVEANFEFGNMIFSRTPILASRNILLPRNRSIDKFNIQRGALEALVETESGPVRFYSVHLDHRSSDERERQLGFLMSQINAYTKDGGAITGAGEFGFEDLPHPESYIMMGDFNMEPESPEYAFLCGRHDGGRFGRTLLTSRPVDAADWIASAGEPLTTWVKPEDPGNQSLWKRLDYCFISADLAGSVRSVDVDQAATGSDHQPLWVEIG